MSLLALAFAATSAGAIPGPACGWRPAGAGRDLCLHYQLLIADRSEVLGLATAISDPVVRGAGVTTWMRANRHDLAAADVLELCGILPREEEATCVRRTSAQHLL